MSRYRFQPAPARGYFWTVCSFALAVFLIPSLVLFALPDKKPEFEPVVLGSPMEPWKVPVESQRCAFTPASQTGWGYSCVGAKVSTMVTQAPKDKEKALRRALRAHARLDGKLSDGPLFTHGNTQAVVDKTSSALAILHDGEGEHEGKIMLAIVQGPGKTMLPVASDVWAELAGKPLPAEIKKELKNLKGTPELKIPKLRDAKIPVREA